MKQSPLPHGEKLFKAILNNPEILTKLNVTYKYDKDFLELYYIILGDEIAPYIPTEILKAFKNNKTSVESLPSKPNITLENEEQILHKLLTDITYINKIPTNIKYKNSFLELFYIFWGDEIQNYIPNEMYEQLKNEMLMHEYHNEHIKKYEKWPKILKK